jgi:hypothetical protein
LIAALLALIATLGSGRTAGADMIAGWDFSQYFGDGLLSIDGATFANTLAANYSHLDESFNAGAESAAFGAMYINGQFGSSTVNTTPGQSTFTPTLAAGGSLAGNINFPVRGVGDNPFDSFSILTSEGQAYANSMAMTATGTVSVVFAADLASIDSSGKDWSLSLGGKTFSGTSNVGVEFSTNCSSYTSFGSLALNTVDKAFSLNLGTQTTDLACVRLNFSNASGQPIIDNLAISATVVPEPGTIAQLAASVLALVAIDRLRKRSGAAR